ncbi:MAG: transposase [Algoriphagus sp.]|jgi:transposase
MARRDQFTMSESERRIRRFSENFRKDKVRELEIGLVTISDLCKQYQVSDMTVLSWLIKFSSMKEKKERLIVESQSDTIQLLDLKKKVAELERVVGQKQLLIDFQLKMIELAEDEYRIDIKKKFSGEPSSSTGKAAK